MSLLCTSLRWVGGWVEAPALLLLLLWQVIVVVVMEVVMMWAAAWAWENLCDAPVPWSLDRVEPCLTELWPMEPVLQLPSAAIVAKISSQSIPVVYASCCYRISSAAVQKSVSASTGGV
jgi:hypothetical protein